MSLPAGLISITPDRRGFIDGQGQRFIPWGLNYDRSYYQGADVLLEELIDRCPAKLAEDFGHARDLGANTVRIFLQHMCYQPRLGQIDQGALERLDLAIQAARRHELRVDLTGLSHIDAGAIPDWYSTASDEDIVAAEALFWGAVAQRYANEPAIFCYDLQNEPYVNWHDSRVVTTGHFDMADGRRFSYCNAHLYNVRSAWTRWVHARHESPAALRRAWHDFPMAAEDWSSLEIPPKRDRLHDPRLLDFQTFREDYAELWTRELVRAIRQHDSQHLVTIGLLPTVVPIGSGSAYGYCGFAPDRLAPLLDFICIHLYPSYPAEPARCLAANLGIHELLLLACQAGRPIVIEEWFALGEGIQAGHVSWEEWFDRFLDMSRPLAAGWLSFYHPLVNDAPGASVSGPWLPWLERYRAVSKTLHQWPSGPVLNAADAQFVLDRRALLTSKEAGEAAIGAYLETRARLASTPRLRWL